VADVLLIARMNGEVIIVMGTNRVAFSTCLTPIPHAVFVFVLHVFREPKLGEIRTRALRAFEAPVCVFCLNVFIKLGRYMK